MKRISIESDPIDFDAGNDVYLFERGSGQDIIYDYDTTADNIDIIRFAADVAPGDITVTRDQTTLFLLIAANNEMWKEAA